MAQSRGSQNRIDQTDVAVSWAAFEKINQVIVEITMRLEPRGGAREPRLFGVATDNRPECMDQKRSALASATAWVFSHQTLDTAVFHLLYTLDAAIASEELNNAGNKKA